MFACQCVCVWTQLKCPLGTEHQCITLMTVDRLFALPPLISSLMMLSFIAVAVADLPITDAWQLRVCVCVCCSWCVE